MYGIYTNIGGKLMVNVTIAYMDPIGIPNFFEMSRYATGRTIVIQGNAGGNSSTQQALRLAARRWHPCDECTKLLRLAVRGAGRWRSFL